MKRLLNRSLNSNQRGYSLVELSVALSIVAVVMVAALMGTRQILQTNNVNNQIKDVAIVIQKIQRQYLKQSNTSTVSVDNLAPLGVWPNERASSLNNIWSVRGIIGGTSEYVFTNKSTVGSLNMNSGIIYTLHNVPVSACADIILGLDPLSFAIYAGENITPPGDGTTPTTTAVKAADAIALTPAKLATACAPNTSKLVQISAFVRL